ncbi:hypothetical protein PV327_010278 [Microctonus hyperodae]|uniref:Uncharacterized protein n=1 Tax=Microctonus hyperodae TaxID=165561 RepID=A0AA39KUM2_MICHY|nr:hypothetical protein PV327_010278 [Microctonus hyperodae]
MDPKTDDADHRKTSPLKKSSFEYNAFIFDVTLDLSYDMDSKWKNHKNVLLIILTTIIGQIGHKYEQWKSITSIIVCSLLKKFVEIKPSCQWKGTLSACVLRYQLLRKFILPKDVSLNMLSMKISGYHMTKS